jgi:hypothetical protein
VYRDLKYQPFHTIPFNYFDENNIMASEKAVFCQFNCIPLTEKNIVALKIVPFPCKGSNIVASKRNVFSVILIASLYHEITLRP